ncbi:hypothetical protein [Shinella sp. M27]|uniref:hypothetical protein n=1 Tax=Shinella sp. M27 TaxID=3368614 RepID=UPI003BA2F022
MVEIASGSCDVFRQIDIRAIGTMNVDGKEPSRVSAYVSKFLGFNTELMAIVDDVTVYPALGVG